ncbi:MAG: DUF4304 domain-containing protein [Polyangiaceae bacterium]|nr:DUF4304 domain-containing protein [Polyangiaceae bacterium]
MKSDAVSMALSDLVVAAGFVRKRDTWYRATEDLIQVLNVQKSRYGQQYYLNLGIWLKPLGEVQFPKENVCHVRIRARQLDEATRAEFEKCLDLDSGITPEERENQIRRLVDDVVLPFFARCESIAQIRQVYNSGVLKRAAVLSTAQEFLTGQ